MPRSSKSTNSVNSGSPKKTTRASQQIQRVEWRQRKQKQLQDPQKRQRKNELNREYRRKAKLEQSMKDDALTRFQETIERLKRRLEEKDAYEESILEQEWLVLLAEDDEDFDDAPTWVDTLTRQAQPYMNNEVTSHRMVGLDLAAFNKLALDYEPAFKKLTWRATPVKQKVKRQTIAADVALWVTLFFFRQYPAGIVMQEMFKVHERTLARVFHRVLVALQSIVKDELKWPDDKQILRFIGPTGNGAGFEDIVCFADGTILNSPRSILKFAPGEHDPFFCGHKHKPGVNIVCVVNRKGEIWWNSDWEKGSSNDQGITNRNNLRDKFIGKPYGIAADGGFTFNKKGEKQLIITAKPYKWKETMGGDALSLSKRTFNKNLSKNRVMVENVFARLKDWRIIGNRWFHAPLSS